MTTACAGSTITFGSGLTNPITLASRLRIDDDLTLQGPGAANLAISGANKTRLFFIGGPGKHHVVDAGERPRRRGEQ